MDQIGFKLNQQVPSYPGYKPAWVSVEYRDNLAGNYHGPCVYLSCWDGQRTGLELTAEQAVNLAQMLLQEAHKLVMNRTPDLEQFIKDMPWHDKGKKP